MIKQSSKYYFLYGVILFSIGIMCLLGYAVSVSIDFANKKNDDSLKYVSYEILTDNVMPVNKEESSDTTSSVVRPYTDSNIVVARPFYKYDDESAQQEKAIVFYENTYMQNTGVDYKNENGDTFDVVSIGNGTVLSIDENDVTGKTIKIKYDNLIAVYQSVKDISVNENDSIVSGQLIAVSGTNSIGSDLGSHLHFELYNNNVLVDPEEYFNNNIGN